MKTHTGALVLLAEKPDLTNGTFKEVSFPGYKRIAVEISYEMLTPGMGIQSDFCFEFLIDDFHPSVFIHSAALLVNNWPIYYYQINFKTPQGPIGFGLTPYNNINSSDIIFVKPLFKSTQIYSSKLVNDILDEFKKQ